MTTRNSEKEERRKTQIVQAAFDVIASKGYNYFTIEDIANRAGFPRAGSFIISRQRKTSSSTFSSSFTARSRKRSCAAPSATGPRRRSQGDHHRLHRHGEAPPAVYTVMVDFWAQVPTNERVRNNGKIYGIICDEVSKIIDLGIESGEFIGVDSADVARLIVSMVMNVAIQWTFNNQAYNIDHVTRACLSMVTAYLKKRREIRAES